MSDQSLSQRIRNVWWEKDDAHVVGGCIRLLDQSLLPLQIVYLRLHHELQVAEAIKTLKVRGAPVIGVTAAYGAALSVRRLYAERASLQQEFSLADAYDHLQDVCTLLGRTRPTAVNLFWALKRMQERAQSALTASLSVSEFADLLLAEAQTLAAEDEAACLQIGRYGASLIADGDTLLTHCNAGSLATLGIGTALAPIYVASQEGKQLHVFVDETRPVLQGARLTAWELQQAHIPITLITDNMAGHFMRRGDIRAVFVGADRIAANGDVANKIGTYSVAVLAHAHNIPFYVAAPSSTVDLALPSGEQIPIEQRDSSEVTIFAGTQVAPDAVSVANPAFDVTPHAYVTAIITEFGIARPSYGSSLKELLEDKSSIRKV